MQRWNFTSMMELYYDEYKLEQRCSKREFIRNASV